MAMWHGRTSGAWGEESSNREESCSDDATTDEDDEVNVLSNYLQNLTW